MAVDYTRLGSSLMAEALHFTGNEEADALLAQEPLALLIGFALDQQVTVPTAFVGPLKLKQRLGTLEARDIAQTDPSSLEALFREKPAIHRFPGSMARRVQELAAVLAKRFGVAAAQDLVPNHPTLGDVDSIEALEDYQAKKRAHKAEMRAKQSP